MSDLTPDSPTAATAGRDALAAWLDAQPTDLFADDQDLAALVAHHGLGARLPALHAAGRAVAGPLDAAARAQRPARQPPGARRLGRDRPVHGRGGPPPEPPRRRGRAIYGTGVMTAYGEVGVDGRAAGPHRGGRWRPRRSASSSRCST